jgi:uncharacterized protein (UPF0332 family)
MSFEKLLETNRIAKVEKKEFDLSLAERDLSSSRNSFNSKDFDWALSIAYNATLQAGRALMFYLGYRPIGKEQHKIVFEFLAEAEFDINMVDYFDSIRKTRHIAVYDAAQSVSESMAQEAIEQASTFVHKIRTFVHKIRTEADIKKRINFR